MKYIALVLLTWGLLTACNDEESIIPGEAGSMLRYEFPQGTNEWDGIAKEIKEKFDIYLIYKGYSPLEFSRAWTNTSGYVYFGDSLSDEKAKHHVKFMKEHIFDYLPADLIRPVLPLYYFLIDDYRTESTNYAGAVTKKNVTNFTEGLDFWASSIYSATVTTFPDTGEKLREHRVRIMKLLLETAINRQFIVNPASFHTGFNYVKAINTGNTTDPDYILTRGFLGTVTGDVYNFGNIYSISSTNKDINFLTYVFLGMRYTEEEFLAKYPAETYPLISKKRLEVINYMKEKYNIDLVAIARGPEL